MNIDPVTDRPARTSPAWTLLGACIALGCQGPTGPSPFVTERGEFWAEGVWYFDLIRSYDLTEARLSEQALAAGASTPDAALKDAYWILTHTRGTMRLGADSTAELHVATQDSPSALARAEDIQGAWLPRPGGFVFSIEPPGDDAGDQLHFERIDDEHVQIRRGDVWHVWYFARNH